MRLVITGNSGNGYVQLAQTVNNRKGRLMFQYIKKSMWFPTSVDIEQVATIEELVKRCKAGEVERVIIPLTYYGYGETLIDESNRRSIKQHYAANRFKDYGYSLTMSSYQFLKHEDFRELIEELQEQNPVFNEQDYSELESETLLEFVADEIETVLFREEFTLPNGDYWSKEKVKEALQYRGESYSTDIEWWEYCSIDTDGATPYAEQKDIEELALRVQVLSSVIWSAA